MSTLAHKFTFPDLMFRIRAELIGLARDFWKNGGKKSAEEPESIINGRWKADCIRVQEKIWGPGNVLPLNKELKDRIILPLELTKDKNVLDLVAGLGGLARMMAADSGAHVTGLELEPVLAKRGKALSKAMGQTKLVEIKAYDPKTFVSSKKYECIVVREMFYRLNDKAAFLKTVLSSLQQGGRLSFADYCLDAKDGAKEQVAAWLKQEKGAAPVSMDDFSKVMETMGLDIQAKEDLTAVYLKEVMKQLATFALFIAKHPPAKETKGLVLQEIEKWAYRAAALQHGLKFCHFYAIKH